MSKYKMPDWISGGPMDLEYKTYRMLSRVKELNHLLETGNLMEVLWEVDDTLDYLYRYDAQRATYHPHEYEIMGLQWEDLELVFTSAEELETNEIMDSLCNEAIDKFEDIHASCRSIWRDIEENITYSYIGDRKYFLSDGFVFIRTADDKLHIYYYTKPTKTFKMHWKDFKMQHIKTEKWDQDTYMKRLKEIVDKKSDKILIKIDLKNQTKLENHALTVVNCCVFNMLHRDYAF